MLNVKKLSFFRNVTYIFFKKFATYQNWKLGMFTKQNYYYLKQDFKKSAYPYQSCLGILVFLLVGGNFFFEWRCSFVRKVGPNFLWNVTIENFDGLIMAIFIHWNPWINRRYRKIETLSCKSQNYVQPYFAA